MLDQLRSIDLSVLANIVRQDQQSPMFEITDWTVDHLSDKGLSAAQGIFCFRGHGRDDTGIHPWSVILKVLKEMPDDDPHNFFYIWRELLAYQSGLMNRLPNYLLTPRCYGTQEVANQGWIWMEYIQDEGPRRWGLEQFAFAATQFGKFAGSMLKETSLLDEPWFSRDSHHPLTSPDPCFDVPHVKRYLDLTTRTRINQLWSDLALFKQARSQIPSVFCHQDANRRNLILRQHSPLGQPNLVVIDWANFGISPVGADLYSLVGLSTFLHEWDPSELKRLENAAFEAYLRGLQLVGWHGDPDLVWLAYVSLSATVIALNAPFVIDWIDPSTEQGQAMAIQMCDRTAEVFNSNAAIMCEHGLNCADEARRLMKKLKLI